MGSRPLEHVVTDWWHARAEQRGDERPPSVQQLHEFLRAEHGYDGSYKSVRKFVRARFGTPRVRPFRRVETPPGAHYGKPSVMFSHAEGTGLPCPESVCCFP
ncbi:MAG: hypothetical protein JO344_15960 [Planctomycetaceae bacterium]|nr:hypothetical protein [Planctomycetaceae bacterium]